MSWKNKKYIFEDTLSIFYPKKIFFKLISEYLNEMKW
jgi:hypothetical protein